jgi:hypothetical protein
MRLSSFALTKAGSPRAWTIHFGRRAAEHSGELVASDFVWLRGLATQQPGELVAGDFFFRLLLLEPRFLCQLAQHEIARRHLRAGGVGDSREREAEPRILDREAPRLEREEVAPVEQLLSGEARQQVIGVRPAESETKPKG